MKGDNYEKLYDLYFNQKKNLKEISEITSMSTSTIRRILVEDNFEVLRTAYDWRDKISATIKRKADKTAKGTHLRSNGYLMITRGDDTGKLLHRVIAERMLGRKLNSNEIVFHVDGNKQNNDISNLKIVSRSESARYHATRNKI